MTTTVGDFSPGRVAMVRATTLATPVAGIKKERYA